MLTPALSALLTLAGSVTLAYQIPFVSRPDHRPARLEVTSPSGATLGCGREGDEHVSGYAHLMNDEGEVEDKHMFWVLFKARVSSSNAPIVLTFGGGPGSSGMNAAFGGLGPCTAVATSASDPAIGRLVPNPASWTDKVHLLAIDHPVGVGWSWAKDSEVIRNTSRSAAWDVDNFLQAFFRLYPHLVESPVHVHGGSYGGYYVPNLVSVIHERNKLALSSFRAAQPHPRTIVDVKSIMLYNPCSDFRLNFRHSVPALCGPSAVPSFLNDSACLTLASKVPACLDAYDLMTEDCPIQADKADAMEDVCRDVAEIAFHGEKLAYDARKPAGDPNFPLGSKVLLRLMNEDAGLRRSLGVPSFLNFTTLSMDVYARFAETHDRYQAAWKLLGPVFEETSLRTLIYNGIQDSVCHWTSEVAWMQLLPSRFRQHFASSADIPIPGANATMRAVTSAGLPSSGSAGDFAIFKVRDAGHFAYADQPEIVYDMMDRWIDDRAFD